MTTCVICKQKIIKEKEKWCRLTDFDCELQTGEVYYHLECWKERFQITNSERKKAMYQQAFQAINNIKNQLGNEGGMVVEC